MEKKPALSGVNIIRYQQGERYRLDDVVAREEPLEVRLNGRTLVYLMRLPGDEVLLAAGFCFSEGLIKSREDVEYIHHCGEGDESSTSAGLEVSEGEPRSRETQAGNLVEIRTGTPADTGRYDARVVRTGCGGADLRREVDLAAINVESDARFPPEAILKVPDLLLAGQEVFRSTGATHGAGIFGTGGEILVTKEDVGRHNAVDKVLGHLLLSGEPVADKGLILSGRLSYEMVLKSARAGIPLICSVSAPTALGVGVGKETGVTLVGFLRGSGFNVYSHPERIGGG